MASSEVLSQTLFTITSVKLDQLDKQKEAYESGKHALLRDVSNETDQLRRARLLVTKVGKLPAMTSLAGNRVISIHNLRRFVRQADYDPCISASLLRQYEDAVRHKLDVESNRYHYAELYGKLVNEWIAAGNADKDSEAALVPVGREEMHAQRATWEGYVFRAKETDGPAIKAYLEQLFCASSKEHRRAFTTLRKDLTRFQDSWDDRTHFTEASLTFTIRGLLRANTITDQKRSILGDFLNNKVVLGEIADVLNMRMQTRQNWAWDADSLVDQQRQLNGRYRFYPDEDLLQAIFIHHIGMEWGVRIRQLLVAFLEAAGVRKDSITPMSKEDIRRRRFFLGMSGEPGESGGSVEDILDTHFKNEILLDQLPDSATEQRGGYNSDDMDDVDEDDSRKSHVAVVQNLLHLIQSEIIIHQKLGSDMTVIRSDLKWFGPSVPHSSIFAILEFLGIRAEWIDLFRRILECPLRFKQDPPDAPAQIRKRGTPLSTPLADFFAETMLFCMDFAVNQRADGCRLYRLHDDMWLWGGRENCARAWATMSEFVQLTGLEFNLEKTGSVTVVATEGGSKVDHPSSQGGLPEGNVRWGFLKLDPASGRFVLDQQKIDVHIDELRLQLDACNSVFDWIQAWNIYGARFFTTNCGQLANCYSRKHVDSMLATFQRIQKQLFGDGGAGEHLKRRISDKFGIVDIPDGYLYFPVALGGLGLQNPFVNLYLMRGNVMEDPGKKLDEFLEAEEAEYTSDKTRFETADADSKMQRGVWESGDYADLRDQPFMSLEEFRRHRRRTSAALGRVLETLRSLPEPRTIELTGDVEAAFESTPVGWYGLGSYEQWVCGLYGKDMIERFGSLAVVDKGLLPTGLLGMLRQSRFKWRG